MNHSPRQTTFVDQHVGRMLRLFRKSRGMTQSDLAHEVGVTFQQVQKYERGSNRIGASRLWEFCQVLGVSPSDFFAGLEAMDAAVPRPGASVSA